MRPIIGVKAEVTGWAVSAYVGIDPNGLGDFRLDVALEVALPAVEQTVGDDLLVRAHQVCPYSNAMRRNIAVAPTVEVAS